MPALLRQAADRAPVHPQDVLAHGGMAFLAQMIRERNEALCSLDEQRIRAYLRKYDEAAAAAETDPGAFWSGVHLARTHIISFPMELRRESKRWLRENASPTILEQVPAEVED